MFKVVSILIFSISYSIASLIGSNVNQRDLQVLEDLDIKSSFITDYKLQRVYNRLLSDYNKNYYVEKLTNASLFVPKVKKILKDEKLPSSFLYMAMAESYFTINARSTARATGLWQFMYETGKTYGLEHNLYIDERMDLVKSTKAASKYLKYLHKRFGKWYLAAIAYNCGEGRVVEALTRAKLDIYTSKYPKLKNNKKIKEFRKTISLYQQRKAPFYKLRRVYKEVSKWDIEPSIEYLLRVQSGLSRQYLPSESRTYIRKIVALGMMNNQNFIALDNNSHLLNIGATSSVATVKAKGGTHLKSIADVIGMDYKKLKNLNMHLIYQIVPPSEKEYDIYIPYSRLSRYNANKNLISNNKFAVHVVKSGDSLGKIGRMYGISYKVIKDFNHLKTNFLSLRQKLVIPKVAKNNKRLIVKKQTLKKTSLVYKVRNGDTLYSIARAYKVSLRKLKADNRLKTDIINIGDKIVIKR